MNVIHYMITALKDIELLSFNAGDKVDERVIEKIEV